MMSMPTTTTTNRHKIQVRIGEYPRRMWILGENVDNTGRTYSDNK